MQFSKSGLIAIIPALAAAAPTTTDGSYTLSAAYHYNGFLNSGTINAQDYALALGGKTETYCPGESVDCSMYPNITVVNGPAGRNVGLSFPLPVPGGQGLFVLADGAVRYNEAHSHPQPAPGTYLTPFTNTPATEAGYSGTLLGPDGTNFIACPTEGGADPSKVPFFLYANVSGLATPVSESECLQVNIFTQAYSGGAGAWQYT